MPKEFKNNMLGGDVPDLGDDQHQEVLNGMWPFEGGYDFDAKPNDKKPNTKTLNE